MEGAGRVRFFLSFFPFESFPEPPDLGESSLFVWMVALIDQKMERVKTCSDHQPFVLRGDHCCVRLFLI